jgi:hypothetical protein
MKRTVKAASILGASFLFCAALPGCLVVSYSSGGGWWVWPGSLVVTVVLVLVWLLARR